MKIKVIGSGSMWTSCNSASYMIDNDILVDIPNGLCKNLFKLGINTQDINHVLITHFHGDHYFDMPFYLLLKSRARNKDINIYCSKEGKNKNKKILKLAFPDSQEKIYKEINIKYNFTSTFKIKSYLVKKYLVDHGSLKPAFGFVFEFKKKKIGFTGDTKICKNVEYMASICEYLFCDCMFINGTGKHMGINDIIYLCQKYPKCKLVVSHLEDSTRKCLAKNEYENIIVAYDGLEINI